MLGSSPTAGALAVAGIVIGPEAPDILAGSDGIGEPTVIPGVLGCAVCTL